VLGLDEDSVLGLGEDNLLADGHYYNIHSFLDNTLGLHIFRVSIYHICHSQQSSDNPSKNLQSIYNLYHHDNHLCALEMDWVYVLGLDEDNVLGLDEDTLLVLVLEDVYSNHSSHNSWHSSSIRSVSHSSNGYIFRSQPPIRSPAMKENELAKKERKKKKVRFVRSLC
jgi:hypothetical protein